MPTRRAAARWREDLKRAVSQNDHHGAMALSAMPAHACLLDADNGLALLGEATRQPGVDMLRLLLDNDIVTEAFKSGLGVEHVEDSPLHVAVQLVDVTKVRLLLDRNACPGKPAGPHQETALHLACGRYPIPPLSRGGSAWAPLPVAPRVSSVERAGGPSRLTTPATGNNLRTRESLTSGHEIAGQTTASQGRETDKPEVSRSVNPGNETNTHIPTYHMTMNSKDPAISGQSRKQGDPTTVAKKEAHVISLDQKTVDAVSGTPSQKTGKCMPIAVEGTDDSSSGRKSCGDSAACDDRGRHLTVVKFLIEASATLESQTVEGLTPLAIAARHLDHELLSLLCAAGADPRPGVRAGEGPFHRAHLECTAVLLRTGRLDLSRAMRSLMESPCVRLTDRRPDWESLLGQLLSQGADPNTFGQGGICPIHLVAAYCHGNLVEILVQHGADVHSHRTYVISPVMRAAGHGNACALWRLIKHNCDVNVTSMAFHTKRRISAFGKALEGHHFDCARMLIIAGCDVEPDAHESFLTGADLRLACSSKRHPWLTLTPPPAFCQWYRTFQRDPLTLKHMCRLGIRRELGSAFYSHIENTDLIPNCIKQYLYMGELDPTLPQPNVSDME